MGKQSNPSAGQALVNLADYDFVLEPRYYFYGWAKTARLCARKSAVNALFRATKLLPHGCKFKIWDAQRPYAVHLAMLQSFQRRLRLLYPGASPKEIRTLQRKFGGRALRRIARPDTHRNGGSFDLTIVDRKGNEFYMGTDHDDLTPRAALDYFERKTKLTPLDRIARANRRLLKQVMLAAGFISYPPEWWHWSVEK